LDDFFREFGGGGFLVPIERFEIITDELFVEAQLGFPWLVTVLVPEP
jgi:hypothetical protein